MVRVMWCSLVLVLFYHARVYGKEGKEILYLADIKQLLDEAENYADRRQYYLPKPKAEADKIDRGLDNS